ncbi:MAG: hypothetical protein JG765_2278 [Cereibacter sp.]|nr:hypothetical protein [Cereibacter sp.]
MNAVRRKLKGVSDGDRQMVQILGHVAADGFATVEAACREEIDQWITAVGAKTAYIELGSPWENGYCESFNSKLRDELLNGEIFYSLAEAKIIIEGWRRHYNTKRPHSSLGYRPPRLRLCSGRLRHPAPLRRPPQP